MSNSKFDAIRYWFRVTVILPIAFASGAAHANYACTGKVGYLGLGGTGNLTIALSGVTQPHVICNINSAGTYGITAASCKMMYAAAISARIADKSLVIYYEDNGFSCGTIPGWTGVASAYFMEGPNN